ncbi:MAG: TusE/DsrC/DsvC family sulfur relay protein [Methylococcaceae bacterium]
MDVKHLAVTEQGFLIDAQTWTENWATMQAVSYAIELSPAHWEIIHFMREYYITYKHLPNTRMFIKAVAIKLGTEKGNSRYIQVLFPQTPLKLVCLLAGLPKPPNCL